MSVFYYAVPVISWPFSTEPDAAIIVEGDIMVRKAKVSDDFMYQKLMTMFKWRRRYQNRTKDFYLVASLEKVE